MNITISNSALTTSFETYLQAAYSAPLLSAEEEHEIACKFYNHQDRESAHKLIFSHIKFVAKIARNYKNIGLNLSDLIQEGTVGLIKALQNFNPFHGVRFASFALHWVRSEIHELILKNWSLVKIATTKAQRKVFFNLHKFNKTTRFFSEDDIAKIAEFLCVPEKDVRKMVQRMAYNGDIYTEELEDPIMLDSHSNHADEIEALDWKSHRQEAVTQAVKTLDPRSKKIIEKRWLDTEKKTSLKELAQEFNISLVRISQIEKKAMSKLQQILKDLLKQN